MGQLKTLTILDQSYQLLIFPGYYDSLVIDEDRQQILINTFSLTSAHLGELIDRKMRPFALKKIKLELNKLAAEFGFEYNRLTLRRQSSCFGSCSGRNNLNFNWQIIFLPYPIFRHLLLHELTHLSVKNHKRQVGDQLKFYDPQTEVHHHWLKTNGRRCFLFLDKTALF